MGNEKEKKAAPKGTTEEKGGVDLKYQGEKARSAMKDAQPKGDIASVISLLYGGPNTGYTNIDGIDFRTPNISPAVMKVLQNEAASRARHATWKKHDEERADRIAKGKQVLTNMVNSINAGIRKEDSVRHPFKAAHWNAKAGKLQDKMTPDGKPVLDEYGNRVKGNPFDVNKLISEAGGKFKGEFEKFVSGLASDNGGRYAGTYKGGSGDVSIGTSSDILKSLRGIGVVKFDENGHQSVDWSKVTSQDQYDSLRDFVGNYNNFQGEQIQAQRMREKGIVDDARRYAKEFGVTLPDGATDAQVIRTVFADKAKKASDAVNKGDAGAAGRLYGSANIYDAAQIMKDSIDIAKSGAGAGAVEVGNSALSDMISAVQRVATDAEDAATNPGGTVYDAVAEQQSATSSMNESLRGNKAKGIEGTNVEATRKLAEQKDKVEAAKQKPKEGAV